VAGEINLPLDCVIRLAFYQRMIYHTLWPLGLALSFFAASLLIRRRFERKQQKLLEEEDAVKQRQSWTEKGQQIFKSIDKNKDKKLDRTEFVEALKSLKVNDKHDVRIDEIMIDKMFAELDGDRNQKITEKEWLEKWTSQLLSADDNPETSKASTSPLTALPELLMYSTQELTWSNFSVERLRTTMKSYTVPLAKALCFLSILMLPNPPQVYAAWITRGLLAAKPEALDAIRVDTYRRHLVRCGMIAFVWTLILLAMWWAVSINLFSSVGGDELNVSDPSSVDDIRERSGFSQVTSVYLPIAVVLSAIHTIMLWTAATFASWDVSRLKLADRRTGPGTSSKASDDSEGDSAPLTDLMNALGEHQDSTRNKHDGHWMIEMSKYCVDTAMMIFFLTCTCYAVRLHTLPCLTLCASS
jgi:hypothetical protein